MIRSSPNVTIVVLLFLRLVIWAFEWQLLSGEPNPNMLIVIKQQMIEQKNSMGVKFVIRSCRHFFETHLFLRLTDVKTLFKLWSMTRPLHSLNSNIVSLWAKFVAIPIQCEKKFFRFEMETLLTMWYHGMS